MTTLNPTPAQIYQAAQDELVKAQTAYDKKPSGMGQAWIDACQFTISQLSQAMITAGYSTQSSD